MERPLHWRSAVLSQILVVFDHLMESPAVPDLELLYLPENNKPYVGLLRDSLRDLLQEEKDRQQKAREEMDLSR